MTRVGLAIRSGSLLTKKIKFFFSDSFDGRCALGAICEVVGIICKNSDPYSELRESFKELSFDFFYILPNLSKSKTQNDLLTIIWRLNDCTDKSREEIAQIVDDLLENDPRYIELMEKEKVNNNRERQQEQPVLVTHRA